MIYRFVILYNMQSADPVAQHHNLINIPFCTLVNVFQNVLVLEFDDPSWFVCTGSLVLCLV